MSEFSLCNSFNYGKTLSWPSAARGDTGVHWELPQLVPKNQVCPRGCTLTLLRALPDPLYPLLLLSAQLQISGETAFLLQIQEIISQGMRTCYVSPQEHWAPRAQVTMQWKTAFGFTSNKLLFSPGWLWVWRSPTDPREQDLPSPAFRWTAQKKETAAVFQRWTQSLGLCPSGSASVYV